MLLGRTPPPRCSRLGVVCLAYLWRRDQEELLQEMIEAGVKAVIIKVASMGRSRLPACPISVSVCILCCSCINVV